MAITFTSPALAELSFVGAGASQCQAVNSNVMPGRGSTQNSVSMLIFSWVQGYMSGFNSYSLLLNQTSPFDLGATSPEAQWEYIVSYCRSHPADFIVKAIQDLELKLLKK
jgi:hypothetical protein